MAQSQIPSYCQGISKLKTGIEGPGAEMPIKVQGIPNDADDGRKDEVKTIIKKDIKNA